MKRGGGRRYYRPDDIELLRGIRTLLYSEGYTIRGVQRILKEQGPRVVIAAGKGAVAEADGNDQEQAPPAPRRVRRAPPVHAAVESVEDDDDTPEDDDTEAEVEEAEADDNDAADDDGGELALDADDDAAEEGDDEDDAAAEAEDGGPDDADEDDAEEEDEPDDQDDDDDADDDDSDDTDDDEAEKSPRVEPAFNPREFRSRATPTTAPRAQGVGTRPPALSPEDFRRLNATLAELLELKRTLDQARG